MNLSELKTGEKGIIVKVRGHGGFRKRIIEMGFVKGKTVEVLLNAPLQDPVKYKLMGYEVSLRHDEANLIVVLSEGEARQEGNLMKELWDEAAAYMQAERPTERVRLTDQQLLEAAREKRRSINVALIGNPNCGKTSLFNYASGAHGRVGNYSGVTVDASEAHFSFEDYELNMTDLPGTYSLSCYSPEELYVRRHLMESSPDIVINIVDASNIERNLYLTTQLIDMNLRMVCALNMYDEFERRGDTLDLDTLSTLFGVPMVPTSFKNGVGVKDLLSTVIQVYEDTNRHTRHIHINYGHEIEDGIRHIQEYIKPEPSISLRYSTRYVSLKLLEHDSDIADFVSKAVADKAEVIFRARDKAASRVLEETKSDSETSIMDARYGFIHGAMAEAGYREGNKKDTYRTTHILDSILSDKYLGFPVFFFLLFVMFHATFSIGQYPTDWIGNAVTVLGEWTERILPPGPLRSLIADGVVGGVGAVIVFLPQILILYFFISMMEDSGYMARAAFIMDRLMHKMGLHGKSFIPLIMAFGCNVPAVMATRTIESRRSRLVTVFILPFMSCSARLPIYIMLAGTFFPLQYRSWVLISLYLVGISVAVIVSKLFTSFVFKGDDIPFVMELPPYRMPTAKAICRHTWEKGKEYLKKMGGIILVASIIVWALEYFPHDDNLSPQQQQRQSCIGQLGQAVEPLFQAQGFNWKLDVSLLAGVGAKEIVASTIGVLYSGDDSIGGDENSYRRLHRQMSLEGITPLSAYCYLLFVLLYFPCLATIAAIRHETGSWRWTLLSASSTTLLAWVFSATVYQLCGLFL